MSAKPPPLWTTVAYGVWLAGCLILPFIPVLNAQLTPPNPHVPYNGSQVIAPMLRGVVLWIAVMLVVSYFAGRAYHRRMVEFGSLPNASSGTLGCAFAIIGTLISLTLGFAGCTLESWLSR